MDGDPTLIQQRLQFPERLLTGLIFGQRVSGEHREHLIALNRFRTSKLAFYEARRTAGDVEVSKLTL
jgi:hypothetical protein